MKMHRLLPVALFSSLLCVPLAAQSQGPYVGLAGHYYHPDDDRNGKDGSGGSLTFGMPLQGSEVFSLEGLIYGSFVDDPTPAALNEQLGAGIDLRALLSQNRFLTPFVLMGVGVTQTNLAADDHADAYINAGLGALLPMGSSGFALRTDARAVGIFDSETTPDEFVTDYRVSLGLEYRFDADVPATPAAIPAAEPAPAEIAAADNPVVDSDQDGVPDALDECPDSAPGVQVDAKGCLVVPPPPPDSDKDGVLNDADQCPETAAGIRVDAKGCALDLDADGVMNDEDACADTAAGLKVDAKGCVVTQTLVLNSILFASASADLLDESKLILDGIASSLQGQPSTYVLIIGHTDALGTQASNLTLSQQRADTVRGYLISRGVNGDRLESEGYGEFNPVASDETEEGRAKNRRVEFRIATQP